MKPDEPVEASILDRLVRAIQDEDIDAFGKLYAVDALLYEPMFPEGASGRAEIMDGEAALFRGFSAISISVRNVFGSTRHMLAELVLRATNDSPLELGGGEIPATGRRIEVPMVWSLDLDAQGLIAEERDYFDTALIMRQLGLADD